MKKLVLAVCLAGSICAFAQARETVKPGDPGLRREAAPAPLVEQHPDRPQAPIARYSSPMACNFFGISIPSADPLDVCGLRLNISIPFATPNHRNVTGFDLGFSGEAMGETGGIAINLCDNWSDVFTGGAISFVNVTGELHGLQIGLVNSADTGSGIQIGLWNQSANFKCPIIGVVW